MTFLLPDDFLNVMTQKGYRVFDNQLHAYNLNIVGYRNSKPVTDKFSDNLCIYWKYNNRWSWRAWPITTLPGKPWLLNPMDSKKGCAILVPDQYIAAYKIGLFRGYSVLRQDRAMRVYRDNTRDEVFHLDPNTIEEGVFGIHIHKAGLWSKLVGTSSAGCQVFQKKDDFEAFMSYCRMAQIDWGDRFSYTLIEL